MEKRQPGEPDRELCRIKAGLDRDSRALAGLICPEHWFAEIICR